MHPTTNDAPAISVRGLVKRYGDVAAVDGIDLDVHPGEIFALLGPNGAGKTTTVEILEGHRHRGGGQVSVLGQDPARAGNAWRARIGIVLQEAGVFNQVSVREVLTHFAGYYPRPRDPEALIASVGLAEKADARVSDLSGGQRRRLDVALGVVGRPELVFLDEPTTGFDPEARRQFWDLIEGLRDDGATVLLTTHYLDEAERLADRVGVIARGRLLALGTPADLGGRAQAAAQVSWTDADGTHAEETDTPTALVTRLAERFGGEVPELAVTRPSLEDVYLRLIGDQS